MARISACFLALKSAATELRRSNPNDNQSTAAIEDLLWNAALKIEDGNRPEAEKELRSAEEALEKALKDPNTPASEIARLTQNLKDAMNKDIQAMAENLRKAQERGDQQPKSDPNTPTIDQHELNDQVDKMNQMAQSGSRDAARTCWITSSSCWKHEGGPAGPGRKTSKARSRCRI